MTDTIQDIPTVILNNLPSGVALLDAAGVVRYTNPRLAVLLGQPTQDWLGRAWDACLTQAAIEVDPDTLNDIHLEERILSRRREALADGSRLEILEDVTWLRGRDDMLHSLFMVWDEGMSHVAHELRNPLTAILGYSTLLRDRLNADEEKRHDWAARTVAKGHTLRDVIKAFAEVSRFLVDRHRLTRHSLDLALLGQEIVADVRSQRPVELTAETVWVTGDRAWLKQAVCVLVDNALKYTPPGSPITIRIAPEAKQGVISVIDTAPGIAPDYQTTIFEPFRRGPAMEDIPGYGLGLTIARGIAAAHSGALLLNSEPGRGSTFSLQLPLDLSADPTTAT